MDSITPGFPVLHQLPDFLKLMSIESVMPSSIISFSVNLFSSWVQSFPASGSFPKSQLITSGGQSTGASASGSVLPMIIKGWFPLGLTGLITMLSKGLSRVFSNTTVQKHQFFGVQPFFLLFSSHIHLWLLQKPQLWQYGLLSAKNYLCFSICCLGLSLLFFQGASIF